MTRSINGTGWAVMVDQESVQKAVDFFRSLLVSNLFKVE